MKAHLAKVSLALLSAVFLLGCQEQGSQPVGPDGPQFDRPSNKPCPVERDIKDHCHVDDVDPDPSTLNLANGMDAAALPVLVVKDTDKTLKVINTDFMTPGITMKFTDLGLGDCVAFNATKSGTSPDAGEVAKLVEELTAPVTSGFFEMKIDRTSPDATSDGHGLLVSHDGTFFDRLTGHTRIMLGSPFSQVDPVKVTEVDGVVTFTGPVVVWAHGVGGGGGTKSDRIIQCPGENKVTATLTQ